MVFMIRTDGDPNTRLLHRYIIDNICFFYGINAIVNIFVNVYLWLIIQNKSANEMADALVKVMMDNIYSF